MKVIFDNIQLVTPRGVQPGSAVAVEDGIIRAILSPKQKRPRGRVIPCGGKFLSAGFIDLHIHGALGHDAMEASLDSWNKISRFHASGGSTHLALTTVACGNRELEEVLTLASRRPELEGAALLGIHVEGPCLSPNRPGAHDLKTLQAPNAALNRLLLRHAKVITQVTLAPELPGALPLIRSLVRHKIIASAGHTDGTFTDYAKARKAGLAHATHLFNCMSTAVKKGPFRQPGMLESILADPCCLAEIIADSYHVAPGLLRLAHQAKNVNGLMLITDATAGAGLRAGKTFHVGKHFPARVHRGYALTLDGQALAGSTVTMIEGVKNLVQKASFSLPEAIQLATLNPARALGREHELGSLQKNFPAHLVLFDDSFRVHQTWRDGIQIFPFPR